MLKKESNQKVPVAFIVLEVALAIVALTVSLLNTNAFMLFVSVFGFSMVGYGLVLLAIGVFTLIALLTYGLPSLPKKIAAATSILTIAMAIGVFYLQVILLNTELLHYLFGVGLLSYAIGLVAFGSLTHKPNSALKTLLITSGVIVALLSVIVIVFRLFPLSVGSPAISLAYTYFMNVALIVIGIQCLVTALIGIALRYKNPKVAVSTL